jgi:carbonic anhydrase
MGQVRHWHEGDFGSAGKAVKGKCLAIRFLRPNKLVHGIATSNQRANSNFQHLPQPGDPPMTVDSFDLTQILPSLSRSFRYPGSLTAPAAIPGFPPIEEQVRDDVFPEIVQWVVVRDFLHLSPKQIAAFRALFPEPHGNSRPTQPIAGRTVEASVRAQ